MSFIKLDKKNKQTKIEQLEISNVIVFNYFNNLPANERDDKFLRAIYIGVLALMEDRISTFLSKTTNELGTELESLKMIFEMKKELFYKTTMKGTLAEEDIAEFLNNYFNEKKLRDRAHLTGTASGKLPRNKTGDIVCELDGNPDLKIVIECKFDKSMRLGDIDSKDIFTRKSDTAWSQLIEAEANREGKVSLIVFDKEIVDTNISRKFEDVGFIPGVGFIAIIDSQRSNYSNLAIAYMLARDIALNAKDVELDKETLSIIITRIVKDIQQVISIKNLVESNIENNKTILKELEKGFLLMDFNQQYLSKFLKDGKLTKQDLLSFYQGEDVKDKYKEIEKEINKLSI
jgi:hypothetical protein